MIYLYPKPNSQIIKKIGSSRAAFGLMRIEKLKTAKLMSESE